MHRPLPKVVIDAKDRRLVEGSGAQDPVEIPRRDEVISRRAFRDDLAPLAQPDCTSCSTTAPNEHGRDGQIVCRRSALEFWAQRLKSRRVVVVAVNMRSRHAQLVESRRIDSAVLLKAVTTLGPELVEVPPGLGHADNRHAEVAAFQHRLQRREDFSCRPDHPWHRRTLGHPHAERSLFSPHVFRFFQVSAALVTPSPSRTANRRAARSVCCEPYGRGASCFQGSHWPSQSGALWRITTRSFQLGFRDRTSSAPPCPGSRSGQGVDVDAGPASRGRGSGLSGLTTFRAIIAPHTILSLAAVSLVSPISPITVARSHRWDRRPVRRRPGRQTQCSILEVSDKRGGDHCFARLARPG